MLDWAELQDNPLGMQWVTLGEQLSMLSRTLSRIDVNETDTDG